MSVVIDTNVVYSGLRSRAGASFQLLQKIVAGQVRPAVTVPLVLEYEDVLSRPGALPHFSLTEVGDFVDWWVSISEVHEVHFLWRPHLSDPKDDMLLEAAMVAGARHIVTFNLRHLEHCTSVGIVPITPVNYLKKVLP